MNDGLRRLHPYPFEKLGQLFRDAKPPEDKRAIDLSIGEPKHTTPAFIIEALAEQLQSASSYPKTRGTDELRQSIAGWLKKRFGLPDNSIDPEQHILPVNGTREAIFAFAQCLISNQQQVPIVLMPNPFYQIYEGAALLAGAEPGYINCLEENNFMPLFEDVSDKTWNRCQLLYLCSPGNPTGAILDQATLGYLLELADKHDFIIAADECYSEIYLDEESPPVGLLQAAHHLGRDNFSRCVVFHSLSKRSNVPGMRSGFVAGDRNLIRDFLRYRTYHGCAMPPFTQAASTLAWQDETHVRDNRAQYRQKFDVVIPLLAGHLRIQRPPGGFYLWPETPVSDTDFALRLYSGQNIRVLPGSFLSRETNGINPGDHRLRIALVAPLEECVEAAERISQCLSTQ